MTFQPAAEDDPELVARSRNGDAGAFDILITRYRARVYGTMIQMLRNEEDALDATQEAFVRAWHALPKLRDGNFGGWLHRIGVNHALDLLRRAKKRPSQEFTDMSAEVSADARTAPAEAVPPDLGLRRDELRVEIDAALALLKPDHRAVIVLKEIEGLSYAEIAAAVGCSQGTVMSRLYYARRSLQEKLRHVYETL